MTDPWDLARYLEEHPDDHEQRWRLAKKLYASWEYRHALEHLQVLQNEWKRHINVNRYLAATLYRLGRYDEAVKELREAVFEWPREVVLHEQLARVLEVAGAKEEAAGVWDQILELDTDHATARSAAKRLREHHEGGSGTDLRMMDSDSGIQLQQGRTCSNCGAQNSEEFDRCWQCHAPLDHESSLTPTPFPGAQPEKTLLPREHINLFAGFLTVALFTMGVYFSLKLLGAAADSPENAAMTHRTLFNVDLAESRTGTGLGLALLWPTLLALSVRAARPKKGPATGWMLLSGLFLASTCYLLTWLPGGLAWTVFPAAAILSLVVMLFTFNMERGKALAAWGMQLVLVILLTPLLFGILEASALGKFHNPYSAIGPILSLAADAGKEDPAGPPIAKDAALPIETVVTWDALDSPWLTQRADRVVFIIDYTPTEAAQPPKFEVRGPAGTEVFTEVDLPGTRLSFVIRPGTAYRLSLTGAPNVRGGIKLESLLDYNISAPQRP